MGSIPEHYSPDLLDDFVQDTSRRLPTVAEEDIVAKLSDTSPESGQYEDDSSDHSVRQRSTKRQRTGFACEACHMTFTEKRALARHKKTDHHRKQIGLPPDRKHACMDCGKFFTRGHDLKRHQKEQHPDFTAIEPSLPMESSSGSSEDISEQPSDNSSSIRSVSQASNATDNTSLYAVAEASPDMMTTLAECTDSKFAYSPMDMEEEGHRVLRHFKSEPNFGIGGTPVRHAYQKSRLSDVEDQDESEDDAKLCPSSDCGRDALSDDLDQMPASARQLPLTYVANSALLARLPTKPLDIPSWQNTPMCALCGVAFEDDTDELLKHLRRHLDSFKGQHRCTGCQIDFTHEQDLQRHLQSAAKGHCGFSFPHACMGHHPPSPGDRFGGLSDFDRARLCVQVQNWEQAQLQAYIAEISELTTTRQTRTLARWSEVLRGGSCRNSYASFAVSVNSHATAPCDISGGKTDVGGLQKRLQQMSLGNASSKVRRLIHPGASDVHSRTIDRSLRKAIKRDDIVTVERMLEMDADPNIIHECKGPFIAVALWGMGHISNYLAEHRLDEDIVGSCSVCNVSTQSFEKGYNKVEALLRHDADPNSPGGLCGYPLATAAWMGKFDVVRILLTAGADIRETKGKYGTALCAAASQSGYLGQQNVVKLLIRKGVDVYQSGPEGTALELAKKRRDHWMLLSQNTGHTDETIQSRIACCDEVIAILEAEENKPFKRSATPALGGVVKEQVIGTAGSKVTFSMGRQQALKKMKSWTTM